MKLKYKCRSFFLFLFLLCTVVGDVYAQQCANSTGACYLAADVGQGGFYVINSHADSTSSPGSFLSTNLQGQPPYKQITKWIDTGLYTTGMVFATNQITTLKFYITGEWSPWNNQCTVGLSQCNMCCCSGTCQAPPGGSVPSCANSSAGLTADGFCMDGGQGINPAPGLSDIPCKLTRGYGLYGLIVKPGLNLDPNGLDVSGAPLYMNNFPAEGFRTFHALANGSDNDGNYFELAGTEFCYLDYSGSVPVTRCVQDSQINQYRPLVSGKLYFKILDTFYGDNFGSYSINIVSGVYLPAGFIESFYTNLQGILSDVRAAANAQIISNLASTGRALLTFSVVWTGILFLLGVTSITHTDLLVRLFKIFIITTLISDTSFSFFNFYLVPYFTVIPQQISNAIMDATLYYPGSSTSRWLMSETGGALSIFDSIVRILVSQVVHIKIISLLFSEYAYYVLGIYVGLFFILSMILRSILLWFLANLKVVILLAVAPLFIIMILFSITKTYFDSWLKQIISAALTLVISTAVLALMMGMFTGQLQAILHYRVCWDVFYQIGDPLDINFYFWVPNSSDAEQALNSWNLLAFILFGMLFNSFSIQLAQLCDVLSQAGFQGMAGSFGVGMRGFQAVVGTPYYLARGAITMPFSKQARKAGDRMLDPLRKALGKDTSTGPANRSGPSGRNRGGQNRGGQNQGGRNQGGAQ